MPPGRPGRPRKYVAVETTTTLESYLWTISKRMEQSVARFEEKVKAFETKFDKLTKDVETLRKQVVEANKLIVKLVAEHGDGNIRVDYDQLRQAHHAYQPKE